MVALLRLRLHLHLLRKFPTSSSLIPIWPGLTVNSNARPRPRPAGRNAAQRNRAMASLFRQLAEICDEEADGQEGRMQMNGGDVQMDDDDVDMNVDHEDYAG